MSKGYKVIDIKEFREKGYLQEVNRQFFHPLGMALTIYVRNDDGEEGISCIRDHREEGIEYGLNKMKPLDVKKYQERSYFIEDELSKQADVRGYYGQELLPMWREVSSIYTLTPIKEVIEMREEGKLCEDTFLGYYATDTYHDISRDIELNDIKKQSPYTHISWVK